MKKTFPLESPKLKPARVIEGIKSEVRKYIKRERGKKLPEDVDFWDFDCRAGRDADSSVPAHLKELNAHIDTASQEQWPAVYIEILAKPGHRTRKPKDPPSTSDE